MNLADAKSVHCIGIGGIGVSAIAKFLVAEGKTVSGSDSADSMVVRDAARAGIKILIGHDAKNVGDAEAIVYSEAVPPGNVERIEAIARGIPQFSGAEALAALIGGKRLIAVSGTNGKSTTTALLGLLLEAGGLDPTVFVGSKVPGFPLGNVRIGKSEWFVIEADEYQAKFLHFNPEIAIVTNIEEDHLDFYRDLNHIRETFQAFLDRIPEHGKIILNTDDDVLMNDMKHRRKVVTYGINRPADYFARNIEIREGRQWFRVLRTKGHEQMIREFSLQIPGRFNVMNALAALSVAMELGVSVDVCQATLESFSGIWRRFERVGEYRGAMVISDYGHHPTAVRGTVTAAKEFYPDRRIVLVFQSHHHHRTRALFQEFVKSFRDADVLILPEIYAVAGRENTEQKMSSQELVDAVKKIGRPKEAYFGGTLAETERLLNTIVKSEEVLLFMGAGDIDQLARRFVD